MKNKNKFRDSLGAFRNSFTLREKIKIRSEFKKLK